jgi:hypothetical protein
MTRRRENLCNNWPFNIYHVAVQRIAIGDIADS